jgi:CRP/FNR family transcriptional regulator, cyclic AMP receptor protein
MEKQSLQQLLRELAFTENFPPSVLEQIAAAAQVRDHPAGTVLFREGSENRTLYLICSGSVILEMCVPARGCVRLISLGPGEMVAWSALLGAGQMTATATCATDVRVVEVEADLLRKICDTDHDVGYAVMREMALAVSRRLLATRLQLIDVFSNGTSPSPTPEPLGPPGSSQPG